MKGPRARGMKGRETRSKRPWVWECKYGADPGRRCVLYFFCDEAVVSIWIVR